MKPGDTLWLFDGFEIRSYVVAEMHEFGPVFGGTEPNSKLYIFHYGPYFESREALCEHYRKIFG